MEITFSKHHHCVHVDNLDVYMPEFNTNRQSLMPTDFIGKITPDQFKTVGRMVTSHIRNDMNSVSNLIVVNNATRHNSF